MTTSTRANVSLEIMYNELHGTSRWVVREMWSSQTPTCDEKALDRLPAPGATACLKWACNLNTWHIQDREWEKAIGLLQPEEQSRVQRFRFKQDSKRALIGRLLLRASVTALFGLPPDTIQLKRNKFGKPVWHPSDSTTKSWNNYRSFTANVSHHGHYVILVAHTSKSCGCDVMTMDIPGRCTQEEFFRDMSYTMTRDEWALIRSHKTPARQREQFFALWTLKESFIKAVGEGVSFGLERITFRPLSPSSPQSCWVKMGVWVDETAYPEYDFELEQWPDGHVAATCLGPIPDSSDSREAAAITSLGQSCDKLSSEKAHAFTMPKTAGKVVSYDLIPVRELIKYLTSCHPNL